MADTLEVTVLNAQNLPNVEKFGKKSDPLCEITFRGIKKKTKHLENTLTPAWNEKLEFELQGKPLQAHDALEVAIKDYEKVGRNRLLAQSTILLRDAVRSPTKSMDSTVPLSDHSKRKLEGATVSVSVKAPADATPAAGAVGAVDAAGQPIAGGEAGVPGQDGEGGGIAFGIDPGTGLGGTPTGIPRTDRSTLSDKEQDYQVKVKVWEARKLQGGSLHPCVRVMLLGQQKQTKIKKSTNEPYYNETFFFPSNISPKALYDENVEFRIYDSQKYRSDSKIGGFKFDLGVVYDCPKHALLRKWLLLTDIEDTTSGVKGYLKVSVTIVGPGDEPPIDKDDGSTDADIESNVLRATGTKLSPATFWLKIFRGEDLPQMDTAAFQGMKKVFGVDDEDKELVDPFLKMYFAGKKAQTRTITGCDHPEWNEELRVGLKFPSMCDRVKLLVRDWDRLSGDDSIATTFINLNEISIRTEGAGFLPTFGPCFLNLYGAPREFSVISDTYEELNDGKGTGCAYRGRILCELGTILGELPEIDVLDIPEEDVMTVMPYLRRRKYQLFGCFLEANMVHDVESALEFELSIGNYGNKFDANVNPMPSSTQPTNAVFDGSNYYYLPWGESKPCVVVSSEWEDIEFRLGAYNIIKKLATRIETCLENITSAKAAKSPPAEVATLIITLLDDIVVMGSVTLPPVAPERKVGNNLDKLIYDHRCKELKSMAEEAYKLKENATDIDAAIGDIDTFLAQAKALLIESQNSMPDVIIWMITGSKRVAYHRIPAYDILYTPEIATRGVQCGNTMTITLRYPGKKGEKGEKSLKVPCQLRVKLWLGLEKYQREWNKMETEGIMAVYAETYENHIHVPALKWTTKGMSRHKWSDESGDVKLSKERFVAPKGWNFDGEWFISPELSLEYDADTGRKTFVDDCFENQMRVPGLSWQAATVAYTDVHGDTMTARDEIQCPENWDWDDVWQVDMNRAVDEEGWEYCVESTMGGYGPVERAYHLCRRRRFVRSRTRQPEAKHIAKKKKKEAAAQEGWEYAPLFTMKFHAKEKKMDMCRRRRWHRRLVASDPNASPVFFFEFGGGSHSESEDDDSKEKEKDKKKKKTRYAPRTYISYKSAHKYQLRAYIYQARDLIAADNDSFSDPFAHVIFCNQSQSTEKIMKTVCPTWDQTLIFEEVQICGDPNEIAMNPPPIVIEIFDHDNVGKADFLGRMTTTPTVKLSSSDSRVAKLQWYTVKYGKDYGGDILASFELFLMEEGDLPFVPPRRGNVYIVPSGIRPVLQRTGVELLVWGLRNMKKYQLLQVNSPMIEFEVGGQVMSTEIIKSLKKQPNFNEPTLFFDAMLPKEELYAPPLNMKVKDHREFGRKPTVGVCRIRSLQPYRCTPLEHDDLPDETHDSIDSAKASDVTLDVEKVSEEEEEMDLDDKDIDWWSKFYASIGDRAKSGKYLNKGYDLMKVYTSNLENVDDFNEFKDFVQTFPIERGKTDSDSDSDDDGDDNKGEVKGLIKVYPLPPDPNAEMPPRFFRELPPSDPQECVVRVYIIRGIDLQPKDDSGLSDPYLIVKLGDKKFDDKDSYIPNTLNPDFGKLYEFTTVIPIKKDLKVTVMDYDLIGKNDLIGSTTIDLENRYLSRNRGTCGIPQTYCKTGPNKWRDTQTPKEILRELCRQRIIKGPTFFGNNKVKVGTEIHGLDDFEGPDIVVNKHWGSEEERLSLYVLHTFNIVPEHVETRPLYTPVLPGIEQGKLQMFVDIFPSYLGVPPTPVEIAPRTATKYMLRMVVWNTKDVVMDETSITGEQMSDIYVKGWIDGVGDKQKTDIHYRSMDGEGMFNWRLLFPFSYLSAENVVVVKKKEHFWSLDSTETRVPARLMVQVWDNDKFSKDDFLGTIVMPLNQMPSPSKSSSSCSLDLLLDQPNGNGKAISLFQQKSIHGWWPVYNDEGEERELTGKVELEMELVTEEEHKEKECGSARKEPNAFPLLEKPKRPETSFLWFTSPWKTFKFIVWKKFKWYFIGGLIILLIVVFLALFFYNLPGTTLEAIFGV